MIEMWNDELREELSANAARRARLIESAQRLNRLGHDMRNAWLLELAEDIYAEVRDAR